MKCSDVRENLSLYIDGELEKLEAEEIEKHFESCDDCKKEMLFFKDMINAVGSIEEKELPQNFHSDMMQKIENEEKRQYFFKRGVFSKMTTIAAGVVVIMCVVLGGKQIYFYDDSSVEKSSVVFGEENDNALKEESNYGRSIDGSREKSNSVAKLKKGVDNDFEEKNEVDIDFKSDDIEKDIERISQFGDVIYVDDKLDKLGQKGGFISLSVDYELVDDIIGLIKNGGRKEDLKKTAEQKLEKVILNVNLKY